MSSTGPVKLHRVERETSRSQFIYRKPQKNYTLLERTAHNQEQLSEFYPLHLQNAPNSRKPNIGNSDHFHVLHSKFEIQTKTGITPSVISSNGLHRNSITTASPNYNSSNLNFANGNSYDSAKDGDWLLSYNTQQMPQRNGLCINSGCQQINTSVSRNRVDILDKKLCKLERSGLTMSNPKSTPKSKDFDEHGQLHVDKMKPCNEENEQRLTFFPGPVKQLNIAQKPSSTKELRKKKIISAADKTLCISSKKELRSDLYTSPQQPCSKPTILRSDNSGLSKPLHSSCDSISSNPILQQMETDSGHVTGNDDSVDSFHQDQSSDEKYAIRSTNRKNSQTPGADGILPNGLPLTLKSSVEYASGNIAGKYSSKPVGINRDRRHSAVDKKNNGKLSKTFDTKISDPPVNDLGPPNLTAAEIEFKERKRSVCQRSLKINKCDKEPVINRPSTSSGVMNQLDQLCHILSNSSLYTSISDASEADLDNPTRVKPFFSSDDAQLRRAADYLRYSKHQLGPNYYNSSSSEELSLSSASSICGADDSLRVSSPDLDHSPCDYNPYVPPKAENIPSWLNFSMFPWIPPTIKFYAPASKEKKPDVRRIPSEVRSILKWKATSVTPIVVRRVILHSGLRLVQNSKQWIAIWGKHMRAVMFSYVKEFQKINHFPGSFQIGRKDSLWHNYCRMRGHHGSIEFNHIPKTFVLPAEMKQLRLAWENGGQSQMWILKPPASARGNGVKVVHKFSQVPKMRALVVQKYLCNPYLINGVKFDMRIYVYVSSISPLRIYIHKEGLARFASVPYSTCSRTVGDRYMHLTNYSVNKKSHNYSENQDVKACKGSKWSLTALWQYMEQQGVKTAIIWNKIIDLVIKTIISGEATMVTLSRLNIRSAYSCHELFGFDIMLDSHLKPWLLEVNISPSLQSSSQLDYDVKVEMIRDLMNLSGLMLPPRLSQTVKMASLVKKLGLDPRLEEYMCFDRGLFKHALSVEERTKHAIFSRMKWPEYMVPILEDPMPDDIRQLCLAEDELKRAGQFQRVYPSHNINYYLKFFERPRYYNHLFAAWESKYHSNRKEGIKLLYDACQRRAHISPEPARAQHSKDDEPPEPRTWRSFLATPRIRFCAKANPGRILRRACHSTQTFFSKIKKHRSLDKDQDPTTGSSRASMTEEQVDVSFEDVDSSFDQWSNDEISEHVPTCEFNSAVAATSTSPLALSCHDALVNPSEQVAKLYRVTDGLQQLSNMESVTVDEENNHIVPSANGCNANNCLVKSDMRH